MSGFINNFRDKGVKVDLGIPYDLWDEPSAEVRKMQRIVSLMYVFFAVGNFVETIRSLFSLDQ